MKKLFYYISRIFFIKEKVLLIQLLNTIQDDLIRHSDGTVNMRRTGMCSYIGKLTRNPKKALILRRLLYDNAPKQFYDEQFELFFFKPYKYEPRYEFLKELIKKY